MSADDAQQAVVNQDLSINPAGIGAGIDVVEGATAIGVDAIADDQNAVAIGREAVSTGGDATVIGAEAVGSSRWNTVIGYEAGSPQNGNNVVLVGRETEARGQGAVSVGEEARANARRTVAVGRNADALAKSALALGFESQATATGAIALGRGTTTTDENTLSIGNRDYLLTSGRSLRFPETTGRERLLNKPVSAGKPAGTAVGFDLSVGNTSVIDVAANADGAGGVEDVAVTVDGDFLVTGTQAFDTVDADAITIESDTGELAFQADSTTSPPTVDLGDGQTRNLTLADGETVGFAPDSGITTLASLPVTSDAVNGDKQSLGVSISGQTVLRTAARADGVGGVKATSRKVEFGGTLLPIGDPGTVNIGTPDDHFGEIHVTKVVTHSPEARSFQTAWSHVREYDSGSMEVDEMLASVIRVLQEWDARLPE